MHPTPTLDLRTRYERDGFAIVRGVFADRVDGMRRDADQLLGRTDLVDPNDLRCRWQNDAGTGEGRFHCCGPVIDLSAACDSVARGPRLLAIVEDADRRG